MKTSWHTPDIRAPWADRYETHERLGYESCDDRFEERVNLSVLKQKLHAIGAAPQKIERTLAENRYADENGVFYAAPPTSPAVLLTEPGGERMLLLRQKYLTSAYGVEAHEWRKLREGLATLDHVPWLDENAVAEHRRICCEELVEEAKSRGGPLAGFWDALDRTMRESGSCGLLDMAVRCSRFEDGEMRMDVDILARRLVEELATERTRSLQQTAE